MPRTVIILLLLTAAVMAGCTRRDRGLDARVDALSALADVLPDSALHLLDSIAPEAAGAPEASRMRHALATVKARDKAYITHTSDSLIRPVLDYYSSRRSDKIYPEVLYYGGRVYSDLGDYPTSLRYFQNALDLLPPSTKNQKLRGNVLSQTGELLRALRSYNRAVPYIEEVIQVDSILNDSINMMHDLHLLGTVNMHLGNYDKAESQFQYARHIAEIISPIHISQQDVYLAGIKYYQGDIDSAIILIRPALSGIDPVSRSVALAYAASIYCESNIPDTAYIYAHKLITDVESYNKETGYQLLLSSELKSYVPEDSLNKYIKDYRYLLENYLNQNETQEALLQNTLYNYQLHERERIKAEKAKYNLQKGLVLILIILLGLIVIILYLKNKNKKHLIQLHEAIDNAEFLRREINKHKLEEDKTLSEEMTSIKNNSFSSNVHNLRNRLREELLAISRNDNESYIISPFILQSQVFEKIQQYIRNSKIIPENNPLWIELEEVILKSSPEFKNRLNLLTGGKLKDADFHVALLIKCGIIPSHIAILVGRTKATVAYRRESLGVKIFDQKLEPGIIDKIIHSL